MEIAAKRVSRVAVHGLQMQGAVDDWPLDEELACIAPVQGGLILALCSGIWLARAWAGPLHKLADAPYDTTRLRFNDGKCDAQGLHPMMDGLTTANGLAWSPDGCTAYWAAPTVRRSMPKVVTGLPNTKASACCACRLQAKCWPKCPARCPARPCPVLAALTSKPFSSPRHARGAAHKSWRSTPIRVVCLRFGWR